MSRQKLIIEWEDPRASIEAAMTGRGLEYMEGYISGRIPSPPIASLMNMDFIEVEEGRVLFKAIPGIQHLNSVGIIHGGFTATILDTALGCAIHSTLPCGMIYNTVQLNVHFTRPIMPDSSELFCEGVVLHRGGTLRTAEAHLKDAHDMLYAHATTTCMLLPLAT